MISSAINSVFVGSATGSAIYYGANLVWPPPSNSGTIWSGFTGDSCVTLTISAYNKLNDSAIIWNDGSSSQITSANSTSYPHNYGTGIC